MEVRSSPTFEQARVVLSTHGWLAQQPPEARDALFSLARLRSYAPGQFVYRAGEPANAVFGLVEGSVDVILPVLEHIPVLAHRADPGYWIGDLAFISGRERLVSVRANRETTLMVLPGRDLNLLLERDGSFYRVFYDLMHENMRLSLIVIADLLSFSPAERIARRLALMNGSRPPGAPPWIDLPQNTLAGMLALSPATAHRALRRLVDVGLIETGYGKIRVLDQAGLEAYADTSAE